MKQLLTTDEACEFLSISRGKLYELKKEGMPYIKLGKVVRFDKDQILEWVRQFTTCDLDKK